MRVFITGASGFVGTALTQALVTRGDRVVALSRSGHAPAGAEAVTGDPTQPGPWQARVAGCEAVVHLAGESVADGRLGAAHRERVLSSRVLGTRQVVGAIATAPVGARPRVLVTASGVDYYVFDDSERGYDETGPSGDSFLAEVCRAWEREARGASAHGVRSVQLRTGLVLGAHGGALPRLAKVARLGAGGPLGSGRQWQAWITLDDLVAAILFTLDHGALVGPVNGVGPNPVRQHDLAKALGQAVHRPAVLPTPAFALRLALGGFADYVLHGRRALPVALLAAGFAFRDAEIHPALARLLGKGGIDVVGI